MRYFKYSSGKFESVIFETNDNLTKLYRVHGLRQNSWDELDSSDYFIHENMKSVLRGIRANELEELKDDDLFAALI